MRNGVVLLFVLMLGVVMVWAHGDGDGHDVDEVDIGDITFEEVPTYYSHIKGIIELHCNTCHEPGQIAGDIELSDPETIGRSAQDISFFASIRYMPPWMPSDASLPMHGDRRLSNYEIAAIMAWANADAPLGEPESYVAPTEIAYQLPEVRADMTLQLEFTPNEALLDEYRCFAFPLDISEPTYITGYEFVPDQLEEVHHGIVYLVGEEASQSINRRNMEDGNAGWSCYSGTEINSNEEEMVATYAPGTIPMAYPENTGYYVEPGDILILQIHYNLTQGHYPDHTAVHLQFADEGAEIQALMTAELMAPVEIPCPTGVEGEQCDRDVAIQRVTELYGRSLANNLLRQCNQSLDDYVDNIGENATTHCDFTMPHNITVYGVFGHMHELGKSFQFELNPDSENALMILDIPAWDFHWQDRYQLAEPLEIKAGETLRMTCTWDNSLSDDPRYVVWGEGTADEMCFGNLMFLPS